MQESLLFWRAGRRVRLLFSRGFVADFCSRKIRNRDVLGDGQCGIMSIAEESPVLLGSVIVEEVMEGLQGFV
jgi:hypothetical protein